MQKERTLKIRRSIESDQAKISNIHSETFGKKKGPEIAALVSGLFHDPTAQPLLSLVAEDNGRMIGHILFTKASIKGAPELVSVRLLAPLAVLPEVQNQGIGGLLIQEGLERLKGEGVKLVFVLGHPDYYPRSGFIPAGVFGFEAPYPIPEEHAGAWMVQELHAGVMGRIKGRVACSQVLNQPEHWRE